MTTFYMAVNPDDTYSAATFHTQAARGHVASGIAPALLVSFYYMQQSTWPKPNNDFWYRSWCMDSGGFTAYTKGVTIDLDDFTACAKEMLEKDPTLDHVFTLDDLQSWRTTLRNTERMWAAGVQAVPVYHVGEPEDVLRGYARDYPKIALGGMVPLRKQDKQRWVEQCFSRVWPCAIHGLGAGSRDIMLAVPWHSVDASNWVMPAKFGQWQAYDGGKIGQRAFYNLRVEIEHYLGIEEEVALRWAPVLAPVREKLKAAGWRRP